MLGPDPPAKKEHLYVVGPDNFHVLVEAQAFQCQNFVERETLRFRVSLYSGGLSLRCRPPF